MKRVLILQHGRLYHAGYVGNILEEYDITYDVVHAAEETLPDATTYAAIVGFGGGQHAYKSDKYPYFTQEKILIRQAVEQDIPFLGICLSGQLLASALGAVVKKHTMLEIGFFEVSFTKEGACDPLYKGLPGYQNVFHWHTDTFDLPPGAVLLASSKYTKNQAFRYERRAYGIQYHIEVTPQLLDTWFDLFPDEVPPDLLNSRLHYSRLRGNRSDASGRDMTMATDKDQDSRFPIYHAHTRKMFENFLSISELI